MSKFVCVPFQGYLIRKHYVDEIYWIERDQRIMNWCKSVDDGKKKIQAGDFFAQVPQRTD